jgi:hypothetical protein
MARIECRTTAVSSPRALAAPPSPTHGAFSPLPHLRKAAILAAVPEPYLDGYRNAAMNRGFHADDFI